MLKGVAPAVRAAFEQRMRKALPSFRLVGRKDVLWSDKPPIRTELSSDMIIYALQFEEDLWFFVYLQTASKSWQNWFCVELAFNNVPVYWSTTITDAILPPVYAATKPKVLRSATKFRLRTYICGESIDGWWLTPERDPRPIKEVTVEEAMANVQPMVDDAIEKLCTRGLEWFRIVAEKRGHNQIDERLSSNAWRVLSQKSADNPSPSWQD